MPLVRYFVVMGGALLSLLFLADSYLPKPEAAAAATDIDRSTIRLRSSQKWPEAIRIDTGAVVPPLPVVAATDVTEREPAGAPRDAYAAVLPRQAVSVSASERLATPQKPARHAKPTGRSIARYAARPVANDQPNELHGWAQAGW
jgi:hypothetical protein